MLTRRRRSSKNQRIRKIKRRRRISEPNTRKNSNNTTKSNDLKIEQSVRTNMGQPNKKENNKTMPNKKRQ